MTHDRLVEEELDRMRASGFQGHRGRTFHRAHHEHHALAVVHYAFADGCRVPFVEVSEAHDGHHGAAVWPLSEVVHLLRNIEPSEFWEVASARAGDPVTLDPGAPE